MSSDIPVIANTDRRSTGSLSASTGPVTVSFPIFGGADDIKVFVDGVLEEDWTLTSASALDPTTDVLPANDGRVTFDDAQTGTVLVIGERAPARASQLTPGAGIPAETHNLTYSRLEATLRELFAWGKAAIKLRPGERAVMLPIAASRADKILTFDANGDPEVTVPKTGITGPIGPTGDKGFIGRHLTFDSATGDADPGAGEFRLNHATLASVTAAYIDNVDIDAASITGWLDMFDDNNDTTRRGILEIIDVSDDSNWALYLVTGTVVDGTGYRKLTLSHRASNGTLSGECALVFYPAGDKGADGSGNANVPTPFGTDNRLLRSDGTGTDIQASGITVSDADVISGGSFANTALKVQDTDASHTLAIVPGSNLTANRTLTVTTGDGDRNLTVTADTTLNGAASTTNPGPIEIATAAEFRAGTDTARALGVSETWGAAAEASLSDGATIAVDLSAGINFTVTLADNRALGNPTNEKVGQSGYIRIVQDATGSRTLSYGTDWEFAGGSAPTLSTAANAQDLLFYQVLATDRIYATLVKAIA